MSSLRSAKSPSSVARRSSAPVNSSRAADEALLLDGGALRDLAGRLAERKAQPPDGGTDAGRRVGKLGHLPRAGAGGDLGVAREVGELARRQLFAEEQRGRVRQLVRLVEDQRVARRQELGQPFVAQHHVGEEQMVVDDDDIRLERGLARLQHEAVGMKRAFRAEAVVARRRDERPDRGVLRNVGERAAIAGFRRARERDDLRQVPRVVARRQATLGRGALEMMVADVVRAALRAARASPAASARRARAAGRAGRAGPAASSCRWTRSPCRRRAAPGRDTRTSCRCRCRPRRSARRAGRWRPRRHRPSRAAAAGSGTRGAPGPGAPPSPKIAASPGSGADAARSAPAVSATRLSSRSWVAPASRPSVAALPVPLPRRGLRAFRRRAWPDRVARSAKTSYGFATRTLYSFVGLAGLPLELGQRLEPQVVQRASGRRRPCGWAPASFTAVW